MFPVCMLFNYRSLKTIEFMLYKTNQDLPKEVRDRLSETAQDLYRAAYNSTIQWYGEAAKAHKVAASAVKMQSARDLAVLV
jgi:cation transport regulator